MEISMLKKGSLAPDFAITLSSGETFRLSDWRTKKHVVLFFFPKAFTRG